MLLVFVLLSMETFRITPGELSFELPSFLRVAWKIPSFLHLVGQSSVQISLQSPEFSFADVRYNIRLISNLNSIDIELVRVKLEDSTATGLGTDVSYEVVLKSRTGKEIALHRCLRPSLAYLRPSWFFIKHLELSEKKDLYLPDDALTVVCTVRKETSSAGCTKCGGADTSNKEEEQEALPGVPKLLSDYRQLLHKGMDSDACLVVRGKEFRAHRCVLRARSTVFEAMFGQETAERESGRVDVDDLDPDNFGEFLEYLYTGSVGAGLSDDNIFGLYVAADKYDVLTLKWECVAHMRRTLSVNSFCDVITMALRHGEEALLLDAALFFKENLERIVVTPKWKQFLTDNAAGANKLFMKAFVPEEQ